MQIQLVAKAAPKSKLLAKPKGTPSPFQSDGQSAEEDIQDKMKDKCRPSPFQSDGQVVVDDNQDKKKKDKVEEAKARKTKKTAEKKDDGEGKAEKKTEKKNDANENNDTA